MTRNRILATVALVALGATPARTAETAKAAPAPREGELRGVWIHSPGYFKDWDGEMKRLAEAGFNAVFLNVCDGAFGHYKSEVLPDTSGYYGKTKTDWVKVAVEACHKHGLELHAWRVDLKGIHAKDAEPFLKDGRLMLSSNGTPYNHKGRKGAHWLCPAHPKNVELEAAAMVELVTKYGVDGVHMDYIRFPQSHGACFCENCKQHFLKKSGLVNVNWPDDVRKGGRHSKRFFAMREDHITNVVRVISERVRAARPEAKVSAAVFRAPGYALTVGQNWPDWVEKGYVDFLCPMDYITDLDKLRTCIQSQVKATGGRIPLYPGLTTGGSVYTGPKGAAVQSPESMVSRVVASREAGGDGFLIFQYTGSQSTLGRALPHLSETVLKGKTYTDHTAPEMRFEIKAAGGRVKGRVVCTTKVAGSRKVVRIELAPVVETTGGEKRTELAEQNITAETAIPVDAPLKDACRMAVYGTVHYEDGSTRRFARRSAVLGE